MLVHSLATPNVTNRTFVASSPGLETAAAPETVDSGQAPPNAEAERMLQRHASGASAQTNRAGYQVLKSLMNSPATPTEGVITRAVYQASGRSAFVSTLSTLQQVAFSQLANGVSGSVTQNLSEIGLAVAGAARQPIETRNLGTALIDELVKSADTASERIYAKAVQAAVPDGAYVKDESVANVLSAAFKDLSEGIGDNPELAVAKLGRRLPELAADEGNAAKMGAKLLEALAESGDNINADAGQRISSKYAYANTELLNKQQDLFGHIEAGTESPYARPSFHLESNPNTNAIASALGGAGMQLAMIAAAPYMPGGPATGWLLSLAAGAVAYAGVKGVYNGMLAVSKKAEGGPSPSFGQAFKTGFQANVWRSLWHATIQRVSMELVPFPGSLVLGAAGSGALNRWTPFG